MLDPLCQLQKSDRMAWWLLTTNACFKIKTCWYNYWIVWHRIQATIPQFFSINFMFNSMRDDGDFFTTFRALSIDTEQSVLFSTLPVKFHGAGRFLLSQNKPPFAWLVWTEAVGRCCSVNHSDSVLLSFQFPQCFCFFYSWKFEVPLLGQSMISSVSIQLPQYFSLQVKKFLGWIWFVTQYLEIAVVVKWVLGNNLANLRQIFVPSYKSPTFAVQSNNSPSTRKYLVRCYVIIVRSVASVSNVKTKFAGFKLTWVRETLNQ